MVNKPLTIEGANAGIPGNSVRADESIITGTSTGAVQLVANNISFDGFKVMSATNTLGAGMYISGTSSGSLVKNNLFTGNQKGIIANSDGVNAITMNYFTGNDFGVGVGVSSSTPTINRNGFSGNVTYGIGQTDASSTLAVNATCNWWDAVNGPGVVGVGSGDKVSANITYQPWLVSSSLSSECTGTTPAPVTATGSIIVVKNATGGDGTFGFTSDVPGHNSFNVTTASGTGSQIFTNVATGTYSITEIAQTGWTQTQNQCGINSRAVVADGATTTCIFANTKESSSTAPHGEIAGLVFEDWDADQSPFESQWEDVIPGLTVYLDTNDNGTLDSGELSIVTDSAGLYRFTALSEGTYHVRASLENGWKQIIPMSGKYDVTITSGQIVNDENFGFFKLGGIYGAKWNDSNGNGVRDASEIGIADGKITLKNEDASISLETTTDGDGDYSFLGLSKGMYALTEELRSGWTETTALTSATRVWSKVRMATEASVTTTIIVRIGATKRVIKTIALALMTKTSR